MIPSDSKYSCNGYPYTHVAWCSKMGHNVASSEIVDTSHNCYERQLLRESLVNPDPGLL